MIIQTNGRIIGRPDRLFGISAKAKERIREIGRENVIDSTIGTLMDDDGRLVVLKSVTDAVSRVSPADYAAYAPISGTPEYLNAVKKAVFMDQIPGSPFIECCYTPGGTGAIRNAVSAYTKPGDSILTSDWHWAPYDLIASEQGRRLTTYELFAQDMTFNKAAFTAALSDILQEQDEVLIIINTPAHNPTGYTFSDSDWDDVIAAVTGFAAKNIVILVDIAYLDFSGDPAEYRAFLTKLGDLPENILPLIAFSASKGYTMYGMRCGAIMCMAGDKNTAAEFRDVMSVASRATWSNGNHMAMQVISDVLSDDGSFMSVKKERAEWLDVLSRRGQTFMENARQAELTTLPYDSGFFITIPCSDPLKVNEILQSAFALFAVPLAGGIRISIASNSIDQCKRMPYMIKSAIDMAG